MNYSRDGNRPGRRPWSGSEPIDGERAIGPVRRGLHRRPQRPSRPSATRMIAQGPCSHEDKHLWTRLTSYHSQQHTRKRRRARTRVSKNSPSESRPILRSSNTNSRNLPAKTTTTLHLQRPKTRVISKSHFRDRVVHHALVSSNQSMNHDSSTTATPAGNRKGRTTPSNSTRSKDGTPTTSTYKIREELTITTREQLITT